MDMSQVCVWDGCGWNGEEEEVRATQSGSVLTHQIYQPGSVLTRQIYQPGSVLTHQINQPADLAIGRCSVAVLVVYPAKHPGQILGQIKWERGRRSYTNQGVQA